GHRVPGARLRAPDHGRYALYRRRLSHRGLTPALDAGLRCRGVSMKLEKRRAPEGARQPSLRSGGSGGSGDTSTSGVLHLACCQYRISWTRTHSTPQACLWKLSLGAIGSSFGAWPAHEIRTASQLPCSTTTARHPRSSKPSCSPAFHCDRRDVLP